MTPMQMAKELNRRDLLGSPVKLCGGREFGAAATGWYYSLSQSLSSIEDAVLSRGCGYRKRGEVQDNVAGPFASKTAALRDLADGWLSEAEGREWFEAAIAKDDAEKDAAAQRAEASEARHRAKRRAKRKRYEENRKARSGLGCA